MNVSHTRPSPKKQRSSKTCRSEAHTRRERKTKKNLPIRELNQNTPRRTVSTFPQTSGRCRPATHTQTPPKTTRCAAGLPLSRCCRPHSLSFTSTFSYMPKCAAKQSVRLGALGRALDVVAPAQKPGFILKALLSFSVSKLETGCFHARVSLHRPTLRCAWKVPQPACFQSRV